MSYITYTKLVKSMANALNDTSIPSNNRDLQKWRDLVRALEDVDREKYCVQAFNELKAPAPSKRLLADWDKRIYANHVRILIHGIEEITDWPPTDSWLRDTIRKDLEELEEAVQRIDKLQRSCAFLATRLLDGLIFSIKLRDGIKTRRIEKSRLVFSTPDLEEFPCLQAIRHDADDWGKLCGKRNDVVHVKRANTDPCDADPHEWLKIVVKAYGCIWDATFLNKQIKEQAQELKTTIARIEEQQTSSSVVAKSISLFRKLRSWRK